MGGRKGRLIHWSDRKQAVKLIDEAVASGARMHKACALLDITLRAFERWRQDDGSVKEDQRLYPTHPPKNKLTDKERAKIISVATSEQYRDLSPHQIVPKLADNNQYIASESSENASMLAKQSYKSENINGDKIILHSDNGSPMKGATMLSTLHALNILPSFSRPSVSNDNPYSESLFKTVKYCAKYPSKPFASLEEARNWVHEFVLWYNNEHCHSKIKFVTPSQRHQYLDQQILQKRIKVYKNARSKNPIRWSKNIRNWEYIDQVSLNPGKTSKEKIVA